MTDIEYRFEIAISFAGDNKRDKVRRVAELLRKQVGDGKVFFDEWFTPELAGPDSQIVLQNYYGRQSRVVVTCVCQRYNEKPWTQDEWRAILAFERNLRDAGGDNVKRMRFLPLRFGDGELDGLFSTAIVPDVRNQSPKEIADFILKRLCLAKGNALPSVSERVATANEIKARAKRLGKSQKELAAELGVSVNDLRKCWQGESTRVDVLQTLAKALRCELGDISNPIEPQTNQPGTDFSEALGKEQLIPIATNLLSACDEARAMIVQFNELRNDMSPAQLARHMLLSPEPMSFLFECVDRPIVSEPTRVRHLKRTMLSLTEVFAPACITINNLSSVHATLTSNSRPFAEITTRDRLIAKAVVGLVHGVPIDGKEPNTFKKLSAKDLRAGRDFATAISEPPDLGVKGTKIVQVFAEGLAKFLNCRSSSVGAVRAAIKTHKKKNVHLCVLFTEPLNPEALRELKESFPEFILLLGIAQNESDDNYLILDQFQRIRDFFQCED